MLLGGGAGSEDVGKLIGARPNRGLETARKRNRGVSTVVQSSCLILHLAEFPTNGGFLIAKSANASNYKYSEIIVSLSLA